MGLGDHLGRGGAGKERTGFPLKCFQRSRINGQILRRSEFGCPAQLGRVAGIRAHVVDQRRAQRLHHEGQGQQQGDGAPAVGAAAARPGQANQQDEGDEGPEQAEGESQPPGPEVNTAAEGAGERQQPGQQWPPQITGHNGDPLVMMNKCPEG